MAYPSKMRLISLLGSLAVVAALLVPALSNSIHAQDPAPQKIESDDATVTQDGAWLSQAADAASGGSYLYNDGEAALSLNFAGPSLEVIYVAGPTLGTLAIEVDGTVLRTVITIDTETRYRQVAKIDYLTDEAHELKVYAQGGGIVAVDAFVIAGRPEPLPIEPSTVMAGPVTQRVPCSTVASIEWVGPPFTAFNRFVTLSTLAIAISADGRYVASLRAVSVTEAQVWLADRVACTQTLIHTLVGRNPTGLSFHGIRGLVISDDGRYVGFRFAIGSVGTSLSAQSTLYLYDRLTNQVNTIPEAIGLPNLVEDFMGNFSADGQLWLVVAQFANLAVRNQTTGSVQILQHAGNNVMVVPSVDPVIAANGRYIAFASRQALFVVNDNNATDDVYLFDLTTNLVQRVSVNSAGEEGSNAASSTLHDISADGRYVLFSSFASNFAPNDTNGVNDLFIRDTLANTTTRISVGPNGEQNHNGEFYKPSLSPDARYVVFSSSANFFVPNDTNGLSDVFALDRQTGSFTLLSSPGDGTQANGHSYGGSISSSGSEVVFESQATNLVPTGTAGLFVTARRTNGDKLAVFRPDLGRVGLVNNLLDPPPPSSYQILDVPTPATGQWVMGDWDGDGDKTPGVYGDNGVFYYTNTLSETVTWSAIWVGLLGRPPVVGHFDAAVNHDCIGAVDSANFPPYGAAFALYFTCDLTDGTAPASTFQWLSVILPDSGGFSGTHQFAAGDFNNDGVDTIAIRRGAFIAFTNTPPTTLLSDYSLAQYWGVPPVTAGDEGILLTGDFDNGAGDSFGVFYQNGNFYYRNAVGWYPGPHSLQQAGQPIGTPVQATSWR